MTLDTELVAAEPVEAAAFRDPAIRAFVLVFCTMASRKSGMPLLYRQSERALMRNQIPDPLHPYHTAWRASFIRAIAEHYLPPELFKLLQRPEVCELLGKLPARQWSTAGRVLLTTLGYVIGDRRERRRVDRSRQRWLEAAARAAAHPFPGLTAALRQVATDMPAGATNSDYVTALAVLYPNCPVTLEQVRKARWRQHRQSLQECADAR